GVIHKPTLGYSPYQNAKSEVFWAQVEGRLLPMLESVHPLTLKLLNDATQAWVELEYNRKKHDELGCSPLERLLERVSVARPAPDAETMRLAFTIQEQRMQRRSDGTVSILGVRFEVPSRFRHQLRLSVKYQSFDLSRTWLVDGHTGEVLCRILPLDKTANADGRRRSLEPTPSVDSAPAAGGEPIPPLMRQLLREYERGGLPPAYIPIRPEEMEADHE
ncbi:MAG: IS481 family transposase, partial [Gemmatimonadetes bacterium]|nr:IS481 family transposase [Gemmatimonadota bacterium]